MGPSVCRLPSILLGDTTGDLQEGDELEGDPHLPPRGPHLRKGQGPHPQVETLQAIMAG